MSALIGVSALKSVESGQSSDIACAFGLDIAQHPAVAVQPVADDRVHFALGRAIRFRLVQRGDPVLDHVALADCTVDRA